MATYLEGTKRVSGLYEKLAKCPMAASVTQRLERCTLQGLQTRLSRPLRLTAMLWVDHLTKLKQSCGTHARIMDECNADHSNGWVDVTCLLAE